jgi:hypothetical protein
MNSPSVRFRHNKRRSAADCTKGFRLETVYDWVTVAVFAGLIVLFLQRSTEAEPRDSMWQYLGASVGCAVANYFGNEGQHLPAAAVLLGTLAYIYFALKPFDRKA